MADISIEYVLLGKAGWFIVTAGIGYWISKCYLKNKTRRIKMFEQGDIVKLKSGGPEMTISQFKEDDIFEVVYFDQTGKLQVNNFHGACLNKVIF